MLEERHRQADSDRSLNTDRVTEVIKEHYQNASKCLMTETETDNDRS